MDRAPTTQPLTKIQTRLLLQRRASDSRNLYTASIQWPLTPSKDNRREDNRRLGTIVGKIKDEVINNPAVPVIADDFSKVADVI